MHAVQIHARREEIRGARQTHGGEEATVRAAPQADARGVDVAPGAEQEARRLHVLELAGSLGAVVERFAELHAVTDPASVIH